MPSRTAQNRERRGEGRRTGGRSGLARRGEPDTAACLAAGRLESRDAAEAVQDPDCKGDQVAEGWSLVPRRRSPPCQAAPAPSAARTCLPESDWLVNQPRATDGGMGGWGWPVARGACHRSPEGTSHDRTLGPGTNLGSQRPGALAAGFLPLEGSTRACRLPVRAWALGFRWAPWSLRSVRQHCPLQTSRNLAPRSGSGHVTGRGPTRRAPRSGKFERRMALLLGLETGSAVWLADALGARARPRR